MSQRKEKGTDRISEEEIAKNSNLIEDMSLHIYKAQKILSRTNPFSNTLQPNF